MAGRARAFVAYQQLHLAPLGVSPVLDPAAPLGLAQVADAGTSLVIVTGISMGPVWITIQAGPAPASAGEWEERVPVVLDIAERLFLSSPTVETGYPGPAFAPEERGAHTVTVLARGR